MIRSLPPLEAPVPACANTALVAAAVLAACSSSGPSSASGGSSSSTSTSSPAAATADSLMTASPGIREHILSQLPASARLLYRTVWLPRYARTTPPL
jgi:hypothetical protein